MFMSIALLYRHVIAAALDPVVLVNEYQIRFPARFPLRFVDHRRRCDDYRIAQLRAAEPFGQIIPLPRSPLIASVEQRSMFQMSIHAFSTMLARAGLSSTLRELEQSSFRQEDVRKHDPCRLSGGTRSIARSPPRAK